MVAQIIKTLTLLVILVIFAITLGAYASDGAATPVLILAALLGLFVLNWMGTRAWMLIILLPPVMEYLPLGSLSLIQPGYLVAAGVLAYWFVLYAMGQARFKWRGLFVLDAIIFLVLLYFIISYIRHPVGIALLSLDTEYVGGKEYALCLSATVYYLAISLIPITRDNLQKSMRWAMMATAASAIFLASRSMESAGVGATLEGVEGSRFSMFVGLGITIVSLAMAYNSPIRIMLSWWRSILVLMGVMMILLSGFREQLGRTLFAFAVSSVVYKQLISSLLIGLACYACILFLSNEKTLLRFPNGIQRALSILPGVEIKRDIKEGADHSVTWRKEMWEWAADPRLGYIKDYTWGDGFGVSVEYLREQKIRQNRGQLKAGDQQFFAETGTWHSGRLVLIHRLGYVGLYLFIVLGCIFSYYVLRTTMLYRHHPIFPYLMFSAIWVIPDLILIFFSAGKLTHFFALYYVMGLIKVLYVIARDNGEVHPLIFGRKNYVPLLIKEQSG